MDFEVLMCCPPSKSRAYEITYIDLCVVDGGTSGKRQLSRLFLATLLQINSNSDEAAGRREHPVHVHFLQYCFS